MFKYLPEFRKVLTLLFAKTDELEELSKRVDELLCDEIVKDFTLHRFYKEKDKGYFIYEVKKDDFEHILSYINEIQSVLSPDIFIMAQSNDKNEFKILFRKG